MAYCLIYEFHIPLSDILKMTLREKIFYICAENDLPIMEMSFKQKTLEDIFIELTKDYAAPEKKSRFKKKKDKQEEEDNVSDL